MTTDQINRYVECFSKITGVAVEKIQQLVNDNGVESLMKSAMSIMTTNKQREKYKAFIDMYNMQEDIRNNTSLIASPVDVMVYGKAHIPDINEKESTLAIYLDTKGNIISSKIITSGTLDKSIFSPRDIIKHAILSNANSLVLVHNHPSGSVVPSKDDVRSTEMLSLSCKAMGISLLDHVIVNGINRKYYSFQTETNLISEQKHEYGNSTVSERKSSYNANMTEEEREKYATKKNKEKKELLDKIQSGINDMKSSKEYFNYLKIASKLYNYSFNNQILISLQCKDPEMICSYTTWRKEFERNVKKGEKGIKIICPVPFDYTKINELTGEEEKATMMSYKVGYVFDVKQTEGKELPKIIEFNVKESEKDLSNFFEATLKNSRVPVEFKNRADDITLFSAYGYYSPKSDSIVIRKDLNTLQKCEVLIHEMAHSELHKETDLSKEYKEVQAESIAYMVMDHFGVKDLSQHSLLYIDTFLNADKTALKNSLEEINSVSHKLIDNISKTLRGQLENVAVKQKEDLPEKLSKKSKEIEYEME